MVDYKLRQHFEYCQVMILISQNLHIFASSCQRSSDVE